jgi:transposase
VATLMVTGRADLSDGQWAVLEPLLPRGKKPGRPPKWTKRQLINGIRWRVRTGAPWRDVPVQYGPFMWNQRAGCQAFLVGSSGP